MSIRSSSWLLLALLFAALSLSGCLGPSVDTSQCSQYTDAQKDDCIRFLAVWSLSPETCYQIQSESVRASCLSDSNDPAASQLLQDRWYASGQGAVSSAASAAPPIPANPINNSISSQPSVAPPPVGEAQADAKISKCTAADPKSTADSCARQLAIDGRDLGYCAKITSADARQGCIVAVATNLKDMTACDVFVSSSDKQLCVYYSRGN